MVAKMILPLFGGSPAVWNTCLFFFQTTLLLGYGYSYLTPQRRSQTILHLLLLLIPIAFLPISLTKNWLSFDINEPILGLLIILVLSVSFPFFAVSTSAPLLQKWFANTTHPNSSDPYFLYIASNLGSLLGVISYPIFIETNFSLTTQSLGWTIGYILFFFLTLGSAILSQLNIQEEEKSPVPKTPIARPTSQQKTQWVLLSFLPSSLLLGVTTYLTTDLAPLPLLWAIPLAIYLLTFIFTFATPPILPEKNLEKILPLLLATLIFLSLLKLLQPVWLLLPLHLVGFFGIAATFHGQLAKSRPDTEYLTSFYFWISLGGVLGGLFNAIVAPLLFPNVLEYPLILGLSLLLLGLPTTEELQEKLLEEERNKQAIVASLLNSKEVPLKGSKSLTSKFQIPLILTSSIAFLLCFLLTGFQIKYFQDNLIAIFCTLFLLIIIRSAFKLNAIRFSSSIILIVLISQFYLPGMGELLFSERSFFGVNRVLYNQSENYHSLLHGSTLHGKQSLDTERRYEPLTYFYKSGPIGQVFQALDKSKHLSHIGVMGLGIGTLAAYAKPGQDWTFYEIDPLVKKIAQNPEYFTFLKDSKAAVPIILGDARGELENAPNNYYDLLIMDAFSSDSIPTHLVTLEALQLYLTKLNKQGILIINISNRHINLEPVLGALAQKLGLANLRQLDLNVSPAEKKLGKSPSHWVLLARNQDDFPELVSPAWQSIPNYERSPLWTDNFSNIFSVLRLFQPSLSFYQVIG